MLRTPFTFSFILFPLRWTCWGASSMWCNVLHRCQTRFSTCRRTTWPVQVRLMMMMMMTIFVNLRIISMNNIGLRVNELGIRWSILLLSYMFYLVILITTNATTNNFWACYIFIICMIVIVTWWGASTKWTSKGNVLFVFIGKITLCIGGSSSSRRWRSDRKL